MPVFERINSCGIHRNFLILILGLALLFGIILTYHQIVQIWVLVLPLIFFLVLRSNFLTLLGIIVIVFFGDWLISLQLLPGQFMWLHEILVVFLFLKAALNSLLKKIRFSVVGGWVILTFLVVCLASFYMNHSGLVNLALFIRLTLVSYLLFLAVINLDIQEKEMKALLRVILGLIILQLPVAVIKMSVYGQGEQAIGTYDYHGGTLSTALPLIVIGFGMSYFLVHRKSILYIGLVLGAVAFAIIGGKRGFIFFLPLVIIFLSWYLKDNIKYLFKYAVIAGLVFFIALYFALSFVPTLSPQRGLKPSLDPSYALAFATDYTTKQQEGLSWGRTSTNINVFKNLYNRGALTFLFGRGPGAAMKSRFESTDTRDRIMEEFGIGYGVTGMSWLAMNTGYFGTLLLFLLFFMIMRRSSRYFRKETDPFWSAYGLSLTVFSFVMLLISIAYAPLLLMDFINIQYFCLSGFLIIKEGRQQEAEQGK